MNFLPKFLLYIAVYIAVGFSIGVIGDIYHILKYLQLLSCLPFGIFSGILFRW